MATHLQCSRVCWMRAAVLKRREQTAVSACETEGLVCSAFSAAGEKVEQTFFFFRSALQSGDAFPSSAEDFLLHVFGLRNGGSQQLLWQMSRLYLYLHTFAIFLSVCCNINVSEFTLYIDTLAGFPNIHIKQLTLF